MLEEQRILEELKILGKMFCNQEELDQVFTEALPILKLWETS